MADVRLKDPNSDFVAVVGSPIEAANLRAQGYTDVEEPKGIEAKESEQKEPEQVGSDGRGGNGTEAGTSLQEPSATTSTSSGRGKPKS